jgi:diadenosine tetraphosphatase ApaH/serine/threonine PP2A family protein phosphatase
VARYAIISDLHSNIEALGAVLARLDREGIDRIVCLGDVVGYGPDPEHCIDLVMQRCQLTLMGNHDEALLRGAHDFNPVARQVIEYNRRMLKPTLLAGSARRTRWKFIEGLPVTHKEDDVLMVHGSPRDPVHEYIMKTDVIFVPDKIRDIFQHFEGLCFVGHTHFPGVFTEDLRFRDPSQLDYHFEWGGEKAVVNVGSVGQPRDGDPRASCVIVEDRLVRFLRTDYDIATCQRKIYDNPNIPDLCAARLEIGK